MLVHYFTVVLCVTLFTCAVHLSVICFDGSCLNADHIKRFIVAAFCSSVVTFWGIKRKSIDRTGAISGFFVGLILTYSSYCFLACLLTFFITSSKATRFGSGRKKKFESDFKEGGQRNWIQVICNGGMAVEVALIYVLEGGAGEFSLNFSSNVLRSWLAAAVLSALAGVNGDTWASELATVLSKSEPRLITSFRKVPVGTNGGFTLSGLVYSALGGFVIGLAYFVALLLTGVVIDKSHQAALLIFIGVFAGIFGSLSDSIIGATLQYSGLETRSGKVVEQPGIGVRHISGWPVLNNHSVNLIMSIINSIVVPTVIVRLYPLFL